MATSIKVDCGETWNYVCYVENFPSYNEALKFEWRWKQISRIIQKSNHSQKPIERRYEALKKILLLDKSTSKAIPYSEWEVPINVIYF